MYPADVPGDGKAIEHTTEAKTRRSDHTAGTLHK